ncbi:MAG: type II secretion system major pseudopilin GspG [Pseudomonadota bacterium]
MRSFLRSLLLIKFRFRRVPRRRLGTAGFSLIEMLVAVAIIGLLVGLVGPAAMNQLQSSRVKSAEAQISQLRAAMDIFLIDTGRYPSEAEGLAALVRDPATVPGWNGPYLRDGELPADPWGAQFIYVADPVGPRVRSLGSDGRTGGDGLAADITG